jgi:UDP-4-amino-4-deoxy-L-arabinose formyltransferase/UDP-glucuronic acid dehydrogenase (UDP-4-keto-hexauronic acid decarboxylating)
MNWPTLIGRELRERFGHGVINAHPGDLPRYRGNACPNWAILNGETEVVLTLHLMSDELDAGPVLLKRPFPLGAGTYVGAVYEFLAVAVPEAFVEALDALERGELRATPQPEDPSLALRCYPRRPADSRLDWRLAADALARLVRASAEPFAGAFTHLDGRRLTVWRAHPAALSTPSLGVTGQVVGIDRAAGTVDVLTADGVLVLEDTELEGAGRGPASEAVGSLRARLGVGVEDEFERLAARIAALERHGS